jgi:hypothetical protein
VLLVISDTLMPAGYGPGNFRQTRRMDDPVSNGTPAVQLSSAMMGP